MYFPTTVIDEFFKEPRMLSSTLDLAKSVEYFRENENYPGESSRLRLDELDPELNSWVVERILSQFWDLKSEQISWCLSVDFARTFKLAKKGEIEGFGVPHQDNESWTGAGIVYLNDIPTEDSGTSLFRLKDKNKFFKRASREFVESARNFNAGLQVDNYGQLLADHRNKFEETMRVQLRPNRLMFYSPQQWHCQTTYNHEKPRYTMRVFIGAVGAVNTLQYPLLRL